MVYNLLSMLLKKLRITKNECHWCGGWDLNPQKTQGLLRINESAIGAFLDIDGFGKNKNSCE